MPVETEIDVTISPGVGDSSFSEMVSLSSPLSMVDPLAPRGLFLQCIMAIHPMRVQPAMVANARAMATMPEIIVGVKLL